MLPKLALAAAASVGTYVATLGLPLPESCAAPSPSCGGDLRECLRVSADMRQTTFGGRYVTAEDVARCMEAFNSCISGGASRGGNSTPATSTRQRDASGDSLPQSFSIKGQYETYDCSLNGTAVKCTISADNSADLWSGVITGTVSGLSLSGTITIDQSMDFEGCVMEDHGSGPVKAVFDPGGGVSLSAGPIQWQRKPVSCANWDPWTQPGYESTGTWTPK